MNWDLNDIGINLNNLDTDRLNVDSYTPMELRATRQAIDSWVSSTSSEDLRSSIMSEDVSASAIKSSWSTGKAKKSPKRNIEVEKKIDKFFEKV